MRRQLLKQKVLLFLHDMVSNAVAGGLALVLSKQAAQRVVTNVWQFIILGVLALFLNILYGWIDTQGRGIFNQQGLIHYLIWPFMMVILGLFIANRRANFALVLFPAILWLTTDIIVTLVQTLVQLCWHQGWLPAVLYAPIGLMFFLLFTWQTIAVLLAVAHILNWPWWEKVLVLIGSLAALLIWQDGSKQAPIWQLPIKQTEVVLTDQVIYTQQNLLDNELDALLPSADVKRPVWFWLGIGGSSAQNVFEREVGHIKKLLETQFGFRGRTITLINAYNDFGHYPIATQTSIERALKQFSQKMNTQRDVLMLYVSTHGLENELELSNPPFQLQPIRPEWLREALDRSGIKWRVIFISACYSGSFIPALQNPYTIVVTASAANKTSYGCKAGEDFTYFGRALFEHNLAETMLYRPSPAKPLLLQHPAGIVGWFNQAAKQVKQEEALLGLEPSMPQISVGTAIAAKLPEFEQSFFQQALELDAKQKNALEMYEEFSAP